MSPTGFAGIRVQLHPGTGAFCASAFLQPVANLVHSGTGCTALAISGQTMDQVGCIVLLGLQWFLVIAWQRVVPRSACNCDGFYCFLVARTTQVLAQVQFGGLLARCCFLLWQFCSLNGLFIPQSEQSVSSMLIPLADRWCTPRAELLLWRLSFEDALKHPVLGAGPTRYACDSDIVLPAHPHSFPFRLWVNGAWWRRFTVSFYSQSYWAWVFLEI